MQQEQQHHQETDVIIPSPKRALAYIEKMRKRLDLEGLRNFAYIVNNLFGAYLPEDERKMLDKEIVYSVWFVHKVREQIRYEQKLKIGNRDWILYENGKLKI